MGNGVTQCEWRHAPEARGWFGEILKKSVELRLDTEREGLTFACSRRPWAGVARDGRGADEKARIEKLLNSKVIKSFVPELRSRYVFFVFRDSYVLCMYKWILYVHLPYPYLAMVHRDIERFSRRFNGSRNKGYLYAASLVGRKKIVIELRKNYSS